jgi:IS30 family transposase
MPMNQRKSRSFMGAQSAELRESWQRDPNDNANCLLRRYFSTGTDFLRCSRTLFIKAAHHLNNRPRKTLEFGTRWSGVTAVLRRPVELASR